MSPKIGAMTIQVFQDQVDGLARVFGPPALGALPAQRSLEALERRSDLVELLRRGVFLIEPGKIEGKTQTASIRVIVQCPLRHAAHGDDALDAFRKGRSVAFCGQPVIESLSPPTDRFSQMAALLADEGAQARQ